jgi:hypothetical protein
MSEDRMADGIQQMERALVIEPRAIWIREALAKAYVHLGDGAAAQDVLNAEGGDIRGTRACVLVQRGDESAAAQFAYAFLSAPHPNTFPSSEACAAAAIRNEALHTGQYDQAIRVLEQQYSQHVGGLREDDSVRYSAIWGLPYAETLIAKGERARGTQLASAILAEVRQVCDRKTVQPECWYWQARALAILGQRKDAVDAFEAAQQHGFTARPWMLDHEPALAGLRSDPRYQSAVNKARQWVATQQASLQELRRLQQVPQRPAQSMSGDETMPVRR